MKTKIFAGFAAFASLIPTAALAFPFSPTPEGFAAHLSSVNWNDGKPRVFSGLRDCYHSETIYRCKYGYVKVSDPVRGSILCEIQQNDFQSAVAYLNGEGYANNYLMGATYPCRQL